jgi:hypothetical protein
MCMLGKVGAYFFVEKLGCVNPCQKEDARAFVINHEYHDVSREMK